MTTGSLQSSPFSFSEMGPADCRYSPPMRLVLPGLLLSTVGACGTSPEECRTYANDLGALLLRAAEEPPSLFSLPDDLALVERTDLPRQDDPYAKAIEVTEAVTRFGYDVLDQPQLAKALADEWMKRARELELYPSRPGHPIDPGLVYFVIDARAPWPKVVEAFDAATYAGMTSIAIAFHAPQPLKLPPRAPIDDKLDEILLAPAGSRAHEISKIIEQQIRSCPSIRVAVSAAVAGDYDDKATQLAKVVPDALIHCACRVNMPDLRSTLFRLLYIPRPVRTLHFDPAQPAAAIALPATATWSDAARMLTPTTRNAQFSVAR